MLTDETGIKLNHGFAGRGDMIGKHYDGRIWEIEDGSRVVAEITESAKTSKQDGLPWLLFKVVQHDGKGLLDEVSFIQELDTQGGLPPQEEATKDILFY